MSFCYGYIRVSTHRQDKFGYSLPYQNDQIFQKFEGGYQDTHQWGDIFKDGGISASKNKFLDRIAGRQLQERLEPGDIVICTRINRVCRNMQDFTTMLEIWDRMGVGFVCTADPVDTSNRSPFGRFIVQLMGAIAELESGLLSERASESHSIRKKQGLPVGFHPPLYFWGADKLLHVFKPELEAAELFYRRRVDQGEPVLDIWRWIVKTRYKRYQKRGKRKLPKEFHPDTICVLIELYRRYLWLTERGADVFSREYLNATARLETPMRKDGMTPPELMENRYAPIGRLVAGDLHVT